MVEREGRGFKIEGIKEGLFDVMVFEQGPRWSQE